MPDVVYQTKNLSKSFKVTLAGSLVPLEDMVCSEVILINKTGDDVLIYDNYNFSDDNSLLLGDGDSIIMRGITNSNLISANGTGDFYYRTQFYSNSPAR